MFTGINKIATIGLTFALAAFLTAPVFADSSLKTDVLKELTQHYTSEFQVDVTVPGVVTVKGTVPSYWDKLNVYAIISRINGVSEIKNELKIDTEPMPDAIIKANIESYLKANRAILEPKKIKVRVENGLVVLDGTVSFAREAEIAEDVASWQQGVLSVSDELTVLPKMKADSDANLTMLVQDLLRRDFSLEKSDVQAKVEHGKAMLTGQVHSLWTKDAIAKEMRRIQGINSVDNRITIISPLASK